MPRNRALAFIAVALASLLVFPVAGALGSDDEGSTVSAAAALGDGITYQGRLMESGSPANGTYDLQFVLYDAVTGGTQKGLTVTKDNVAVQQGLFTTTLEFGAGAFDGEARWIEVSVRPGSSTGTYQPLAPRQPVTAAPYALVAKAVALPFVASADNSGGLIDLTNTGAGAALRATSSGAAGRALAATATGTGGIAADLAGPTALQLSGPIRVSGDAGARTAFVHQVNRTGTGANTCLGNSATIIDNPLTNGDPNASLLVTLNAPNGELGVVEGGFGVAYNVSGCAAAGGANKWVIFTTNSTPTAEPLTEDTAFNVLVIKAAP